MAQALPSIPGIPEPSAQSEGMPTPYDNNRVTPDNEGIGNQIGQGLESAGKVAAQVAQIQQKAATDANNSAAAKATADYGNQTLDAFYGDGKTPGFNSVQGENAPKLSQKVLDDNAKARNKIRDGLANEDQQTKFDKLSQEHADSLYRLVHGHAARQVEAAHEQNEQALTDMSLRGVATAAADHSQSIGQVQKLISDATHASMLGDSRRGVDDATMTDNRDKFIAKAAETALKGALSSSSDDPTTSAQSAERAKAILAQYGDKLDPTVAKKYGDAIKALSLGVDADKKASEMMEAAKRSPAPSGPLVFRDGKYFDEKTGEEVKVKSTTSQDFNQGAMGRVGSLNSETTQTVREDVVSDRPDGPRLWAALNAMPEGPLKDATMKLVTERTVEAARARAALATGLHDQLAQLGQRPDGSFRMPDGPAAAALKAQLHDLDPDALTKLYDRANSEDMRRLNLERAERNIDDREAKSRLKAAALRSQQAAIGVQMDWVDHPEVYAGKSEQDIDASLPPDMDPKDRRGTIGAFTKWKGAQQKGVKDELTIAAEVVASSGIRNETPAQKEKFKQALGGVQLGLRSWAAKQISATGKAPTEDELQEHAKSLLKTVKLPNSGIFGSNIGRTEEPQWQYDQDLAAGKVKPEQMIEGAKKVVHDFNAPPSKAAPAQPVKAAAPPREELDGALQWYRDNQGSDDPAKIEKLQRTEKLLIGAGVL